MLRIRLVHNITIEWDDSGTYGFVGRICGLNTYQ